VAGPSVELLERVPLFAALDQKELKRLTDSFKEHTFQAGEDAVTEGEHGGRFYVIESGEAQVLVHGEEKGRLGPGAYFGDVAMIDQGDRSASIRAASDLKCHGIRFLDFRPLVESDPRIAWPLLQAMAKRLRAAEADSAS
jgi:CRP-like cAMP-binding protein